MAATPKSESLIEVAEARARDRAGWRQDLLAALFPAADRPPQEVAVATTRASLRAIVEGCERELADRLSLAPPQLAWAVLSRSAMLHDPAIMDDVLLLARWRELGRRTLGREANLAPPLVVTLADQQEGALANAAWALLSAQSDALARGREHRQLSARALHLLCWRTVAALEVERAAPIRDLIRAGEALLADHDEGAALAGAAGRLAALLGESADALDPEQAHAALFAAALAERLDLSLALAMEIVAEPGGARLAVLLRATGCKRDAVARAVQWIAGPGGQVELGQLALDRDTALVAVQRWALAARAGAEAR